MHSLGRLAVGWLVAMVIVIAASSARAQGSRAMFERFVAPCCWVEGLATHDSPLARELRDEIDRRVRAGEPADAIERDLVARHGERILAVPAPLETTSGALFAVLVGSLLVLVAIGARWSRRGAQAEPVTRVDVDDPALEQRLREELDRHDA
ncbi:cytochrome c-type biogenesis protein [Sandaracinus amylolyticus]|uniref:Cytochrome c-type biogenesis protein n=1 Tax=Sandaracinus amylolyticus TaxID=927083 RepID=A0A0F6SDL7_9BACT|nr:cytochrome c-type biogenesis protein CcmH [Sandaracinus amylolyticus]AKF03664.1 hypothetical protein DB32_000813 [Sandaracinus amylolyticus]